MSCAFLLNHIKLNLQEHCIGMNAWHTNTQIKSNTKIHFSYFYTLFRTETFEPYGSQIIMCIKILFYFIFWYWGLNLRHSTFKLHPQPYFIFYFETGSR